MKKLIIYSKNLNSHHLWFVISVMFMLFSLEQYYTHQNRHNLNFSYNYKQYVEGDNGLQLNILGSTRFEDAHFSMMLYAFPDPLAGEGVLITSKADVLRRHKNVFEYCVYDSEVKNLSQHKTHPHFDDVFFHASDIVMKTETHEVNRSVVNYFSKHIVLLSGGVFGFPTLVSRRSHTTE